VNIFYLPDLSTDTVALDEDESKHAARVLRLHKGDKVELVDGKGTRAVAEISDDHPKHCFLHILEKKQENTGRNFSLHIAIAPPKNSDRLEWFIEKSTEIGIDRVTLLDCEHSERAKVNKDRLEKLAVSAMKQSQQSWLPKIKDISAFEDFLSAIPAGAQKFIAHCGPGEKKPLKEIARAGGEIIILIGPEGDFSPAEIQTAIGSGFIPVSLGPTRLRTETAGLVVVMTVNNL
jgi:16S rRNA (uracil1498-N3)-methyltransferase